jgi:hypothetical protein
MIPMKKLLFCFLLLLTWTARAQNFEGTIKWTIKTDVTDPATKAKMDDAKNKMNTPESQAKMKALQDKMNDPQFKAAMNANPQMKAQMENSLKMSAGGDPSSMAPSSLVIKIKGDNSLTKMEGGAFNAEVLFLSDKGLSYMLNRDDKTYSTLPSGARPGSTSTTPPKVTRTSETAKILGFNCVKYIVEVTDYGRTVDQSIWTTTDIKNIDFKKFAKARMGKGQSLYYEGMEGTPLRIETKEPTATMTMEVSEIKPESLPASDFAIPADFKETPGMFGR